MWVVSETCPRVEPGVQPAERRTALRGNQVWQGDGNHNHHPVRKQHPYPSTLHIASAVLWPSQLLLLCAFSKLTNPPLALAPRSLSRLSNSTGWNVSGGQQSCRDTTAAASTHFASDPSVCHFPSLDLSLTALVFLYSPLSSFFSLSSFSLLLCSSSMTLVASECSWFLDC